MSSRIFARELRFHPFGATQVVLERLEMRYDKNRFCVIMVPLDEWEAKFEEWNDDEDHRVSLCQECWHDGFMMYPHVFGHESD